MKAEFDVQMFHRCGDAFGFIARRDNDTKELKRLLSAAGSLVTAQRKDRASADYVAHGCQFLRESRKIALRSPVKLGGNLSIIHYQPWNIERARRKVRFDRMFSETLRAPIVSWARDMALAAPPPTLNVRDSRFGRMLNLSATSSARSSG